MKKIKLYILPVLFIAFIITACEDAPPLDYVKKYYLEAYIFVGDPIKNIKVLATQPLSDSFNYTKSLIKDANVVIKSGNNTYPLVYDFDKNSGYYYSDTNFRIKELTEYTIEVTFKDGSSMKGTTNTPQSIVWTKVPTGELLYYPLDSLKMPPDTNKLEWKAIPGTLYYIVSLKCLDTLEYGKYLTPVSNEMNRRIVRPWESPESPEYLETTRWGIIPTNSSAVLWNAFKWYGKSDLKIYNPDYNFLMYFIQYQRTGSFDAKLSNIKGDGFGIFASAAYIQKDFFLIKNQP